MKDLGKALALVLLGLLLIGFGVCGAVGTFIGVAGLFGKGDGVGTTFLLPGLVGLLIAFGVWKAISSLLRTSKTPPPGRP